MKNTIPTWSILLFLCIGFQIVNLQIHIYPMPQPMPQIFISPPLPPPPPVMVPIPIGIPIPQTTTTSTTTTTEENVAIGVPFPMPLPIPIAVPALPPQMYCLSKPRPKNCPPCPQCVPKSLTRPPTKPFIGPAFPIPVPLPPVVGPASFIVLPHPSRINRGKRQWHRVSSASKDTSSSSSSEWSSGRRKARSRRLNRKGMRNSRRNYRVSDMEVSDGELVKPVLTYVSNDGDVKLKKRISAAEAAQLIGDKDTADKQYQTVRVLASGNGGKQSQVLIVSDDGEEPSVSHRRKQVVLRKGASQHILGAGRKELVFRPPDDKNSKLPWDTVLLLLIRLHIANPQVPIIPFQPMPEIYLPPPIPPPPPVAIPFPIAIPIPQSETTSTTTTTEQNIAIAVPIPLPSPIQIAIPAMTPPMFCLAKPRPLNCPPCPPCVCAPLCTPPFFSYCSPCHQKCRCKKKEDVPTPMPLNPPQPFIGPVFPMPVPLPPVIGPPPYGAFSVPYPSLNSEDQQHQIALASEDSSCVSSLEWCSGRKKGRSRRLNRKSMRNSRRTYKVAEEVNDGELITPVLTYVSNDGHVKIKKIISAAEAAQLLGDKDPSDKQYQTVRVLANENYSKQPQGLIVSDNGRKSTVTHQRKQVVLGKGALQNILGAERKELVFRPPDYKVISNLSISFRVI